MWKEISEISFGRSVNLMEWFTEGTEGLLPAEWDSVGSVSSTLLQHGWKIPWGKGKQRQNSDSVASGLLTRENLGFSNHCISIIFKKQREKIRYLLVKHEFSFKLECLQPIHCGVLYQQTSMPLECSHRKPVSCCFTGLHWWNNLS